jgi:DNA-binding response OmpR family regulator
MSTNEAPFVLVADDDKDIRALLRIVLEEAGYEVADASDGEEALRLALERPPDLIVLDVMMPKLDGITVTGELRATERTREVPIILLSARTHWESIQRGKTAGADEYMTKPFVPDELQRAAQSLLRSWTADQAANAGGDDAEGQAPALELITNEDEPVKSTGRLVLVAAADENVVSLVSYRLQLGGYEVAAATDPKEAVQLAADRPPDHCVLDASMPEIDGRPVTRIPTPLSVQDLFDAVEGALGNSRSAKAG